MRLGCVLIFADEWIRIFFLVKIAKGVIAASKLAEAASQWMCIASLHFTVLGLICANVQQHVMHRALAFGHVPVSDSDFWSLHVLPFR